MIIRSMVVILLLTGNVVTATAGIKVHTSCQKNVGDGRVLVEDYTTLPSDNSTYKVLKFKATRTEGDWAYGPCVLDATK